MENTDFVIEHIDEEVQVIADQPSVVTNYPANTDFFIENIDSNVISIAHSLNIEASEVNFRPANTDFFIENIDKNVIAIAESMNLSPSEVDFRPANTDFFVENIDKNLIKIAESLSLTPYEVTIRPANTDMFIENIDKNVTLIKGSTNVVTVSGEYININLPDGGKVQSAQLNGNATQQTYSGKNKMPMAISDNTSERVQFFNISLPAGTYTISYDVSNISLGSSGSFTIYMTAAGAGSGGANIDFDISGAISSTATTHKTATFTTLTDSDISINSNIRIPQTSWDNGARCKLSNIQIEAGSTATDYEPYVGGTPAPNPDYPQEIQTVTDRQTVKIDGSDDSQEFEIDLGSIELAKIGTYQDRIYKNDGKWYIEKQVGKVVLDGTTQTIEGGAAYGSNYRWQASIADITTAIGDARANVMSDRYIGSMLPINNPSLPSAVGTICSHQSGKLFGVVTSDTFNSGTSGNTWLQSHNTTVYYALATPTVTEITNQTLIDQLEALASASLGYGVNNIWIEIATGNAMPTLELVIEKY